MKKKGKMAPYVVKLITSDEAFKVQFGLLFLFWSFANLLFIPLNVVRLSTFWSYWLCSLYLKQLFTEVEMNSTWLITSELANQRARKVLITCVVYTNIIYHDYFMISDSWVYK